MAVEVATEVQQMPKKANSGINSGFKFPPKQYSFRDDQVVTIFHLLIKSNRLKLPDVIKPEEAGRTNDSNYCLYHRMIHHPTSKCFVLNDKIQALVEAGVLTLKSEQKKVTANMVSFQFGNLPGTMIQDGLVPIPKGELNINDPSSQEKRSKGLVPMTLKTGEVMWVHQDLINDKQ